MVGVLTCRVPMVAHFDQPAFMWLSPEMSVVFWMLWLTAELKMCGH